MKSHLRASRPVFRATAFAVLMMLLVPQFTYAQSHEDPDDECGESSTPGLVIKAQNAWGHEGPRLTLTTHTSKDGVPRANVVFDDGEFRIRDFEVHRVFLRGDHDDHESADTDDHEGDHEMGLGVGIRGLATLDNGERVRAQFDLWETRADRSNEVRIRWRPYVEEEPHEPGSEGEGCAGGQSWHSTGWIQIQQVEVHKR